jgi:hypothetical protein
MTRHAQPHLSAFPSTLRGGFFLPKYVHAPVTRIQFCVTHLTVVIGRTSVHKRAHLGINLLVGPVGIEPTTEGL